VTGSAMLGTMRISDFGMKTCCVPSASVMAITV
jgi:hypothetical protein